MSSRSLVPLRAVLDAEALSVLAAPSERGAARRRASEVLAAIAGLGGSAIVPAPVLAEVSRGRRRAAVANQLRHLAVVPTDRTIAERAAALLEAARMGSEHAIGAFVAATALAEAPAVVLTGDPRDLTALLDRHPGVIVRALR